MKYVKTYRDRHGRMRRYFRRAKRPMVPLPGAPDSAEFIAAYNTALARSGPPRETRQQRIKGALKALIEAFDHLREHPPRRIDFAARKAAQKLLDELEEGERRDNKSSNRVGKNV